MAPYSRDGFEVGTRTPVESREQRQAGVANDVKVPVLLALVITLAVMLTYLAFVFSARVVAESTFWLTSVIGSLALFFVIPIRRRFIEETPEEATVGTIASGLLFVTLGAYFSNAVWNFTRYATMEAILISALPVGLVVGLLWLVVSTFQESLFRSPFMEQGIANFLFGTDKPWRADREYTPQVLEPEVVKVHVTGPEPGHFEDLDMPLKIGQAVWLARHIMVNQGGFSVADCTGVSSPLSRTDFEEVREWLVERGFAVWRNKEKPTLGVEILNKGRALFSALVNL